ncbi:CvpA family protein [Aureivirga sp. CE67]|uniref:CvpA family protein n=1 Tax=Aureivirga sp. CE67 TaxID=1788983 RepID=UPI0018CB7A46|nr:CvpA family protein [Aureivirga sp. CE67]
MNTFDIIAIVLMTTGFIRGNLNGLFEEVASLASLVGGVLGAVLFSSIVESILGFLEWEQKYITALAYIVTFALIVALIMVVGKLFTKLADKLELGTINSILGGIFGVLKIAVIISGVLFIFNKVNSAIPFISNKDLEDSVLYKPIKSIAPAIFPTIESEFKKQMEKHVEKPGKLI